MAHIWKIVGTRDACEKCGAVQEWNKERTVKGVFKPGGNQDCLLPIFAANNNTPAPVKATVFPSRPVSPKKRVFKVNGLKVTTQRYTEEQIKELLAIGVEAFALKYKLSRSAEIGATRIYNRFSKFGKIEPRRKVESPSSSLERELLELILKRLPPEGTPMKRKKREALKRLFSATMDMIYPEAKEEA